MLLNCLSKRNLSINKYCQLIYVNKQLLFYINFIHLSKPLLIYWAPPKKKKRKKYFSIIICEITSDTGLFSHFFLPFVFLLGIVTSHLQICQCSLFSLSELQTILKNLIRQEPNKYSAFTYFKTIVSRWSLEWVHQFCFVFLSPIEISIELPLNL